MAYGHQDSQDDYQQTSLGWCNAHVQIQAGIYGSSGNYSQWGDISGSLVIMDATIQAANKITDGFVLVSTDGYPNITVDYEHQPYGNTGKSGYLLILVYQPLPCQLSYQYPKFTTRYLCRYHQTTYFCQTRQGLSAPFPHQSTPCC